MNLDNIPLAIGREIYIDQLILWLQDSKKKYTKLIPSKKDNEIIIELIMKEQKKPELTKAQIEKLQKEKSKSFDKIVKK